MKLYEFYIQHDGMEKIVGIWAYDEVSAKDIFITEMGDAEIMFIGVR
jgi:hypothetical protein